ncbi:MAG: CoxG family protein [Gemmatimonadales bacterium]
MKVEGTYTLNGPRKLVWELLQDPDVLVKSLPGGKELRRTSEDHFEGTMHVGVGPVTAAKFSITVELLHKVHPESFTMSIEGTSAIGFTRGTADVRLAAPNDSETTMNYRADLQIGGKIAAVGQRLLDTVSKAMTRQGLKVLNKELQMKLDEATGS